jgi:predicted PurR-regulated permease PerM
MRATITTAIDVLGVGCCYWLACWLFGVEPTSAGMAMAVGIFALTGVNRAVKQ